MVANGLCWGRDGNVQGKMGKHLKLKTKVTEQIHCSGRQKDGVCGATENNVISLFNFGCGKLWYNQESDSKGDEVDERRDLRKNVMTDMLA